MLRHRVTEAEDFSGGGGGGGGGVISGGGGGGVVGNGALYPHCILTVSSLYPYCIPVVVVVVAGGVIITYQNIVRRENVNIVRRGKRYF